MLINISYNIGKCQKKIISIMKINNTNDIISSEPEIRIQNAKKPEEAGLSLWDCFAEITNNKSHTEYPDNSSAKELEAYINSLLLNIINCPFDWSKENKKTISKVIGLGQMLFICSRF
jgi:hypothetical protein